MQVAGEVKRAGGRHASLEATYNRRPFILAEIYAVALTHLREQCRQHDFGFHQGKCAADAAARAGADGQVGEAFGRRGAGEADAIRLTGEAKAAAYRVGVESLGAQAVTTLQLMQIIGSSNVRIVPDGAVSGANGNAGLIEALMGTMLRKDTNGANGGSTNG